MASADLPAARLQAAKIAYSTHRVPLEHAVRLRDDLVPSAGDLVLARISKVGHHARLEQRDGRRATLFVGDEVVVCFGARYAPDQFEGEVPGDLGPCQLAAAGGIAARVTSQHAKVGEATQLEPIGLLADEEASVLNLADWALPRPVGAPRIPTIAVVGTAMNAGKTTTAAYLVRGLRAAGLRAGSAKLTGTGAGGDRWLMLDAGAEPALDFTFVGLASTYRAGDGAIGGAFLHLRDLLSAAGAQIGVLEVADGLAQDETHALLTSPEFDVDGLVFAGSDALGAAAGISMLEDMGLRAHAVSGVLTAAPLAHEEAAKLTGVPVLSIDELQSADCVMQLLERSGSALVA